MSDFPEHIQIESDGRRSTYTLRTDLYAVHDWDGSAAEPPVLALPDARIAVFPGPPAGRMPVYSMEPGGGLFVPTGTVWIRFVAGDSAVDHATDLEKIGFRIERGPKYAPNGAFIRAADLASALSGLASLRMLDGVEHVEAQMLSAASLR